MNYLDVYKARVGHLGNTPQERAYSSGILEFRRYLKYNSHTQYGLKSISNTELIEEAEEFESFDGVILTDKEDENRVSQILLVKSLEDGGPALKHGDLIKWNNEVWLIYQSTTSSYQPHQKFYMVRCQYFIKWIDKNGDLHGSWIYLVGSKDSKIKDNFRTWHNVITPQPNKYINIIMPHQVMAINTEIMVLDEVWYLVDYDQNSVPNVVFMSFTETNLNEQRDSVEDKIANIDKLATWEIQMLKNQVVTANSVVDLNYTIFKNGIAQNVEPEITVSDNLVLLNNQQVQVGETGSGTVTITYNGVSQKQTITVGKTPAAKRIFKGNDKIRVASKKNTYVLENADPDKVDFELQDWTNANGIVEIKVEDLVDFKSIVHNGNTYVFNANEKNKSGKFVLNVKYDGEQAFSKVIQVVSLWQVI